VRLSHGWLHPDVRFDDDGLVSHAGLVPVMALAERAKLSALIEDKVHLGAGQVRRLG
jgi:hypothetical protein